MFSYSLKIVHSMYIFQLAIELINIMVMFLSLPFHPSHSMGIHFFCLVLFFRRMKVLAITINIDWSFESMSPAM